MQDIDPLFARLRRLHTALVSDVLDALGRRTAAGGDDPAAVFARYGIL